jgi:hypothetical protein
MITGIVVTAIIIGIGTWLRWVSRPATISIKYVLDVNHDEAYPVSAQTPVRSLPEPKIY